MSRIAAFICVFFLAGCDFFEAVIGGFANRELVTMTKEMELLELGAHEFATADRSGACPGFSTRGLGSPEAGHWRSLGGAATRGMLVAHSNDFFPARTLFRPTNGCFLQRKAKRCSICPRSRAAH